MTKETISVPASTWAREGNHQVRLHAAYESSFTVGSGSVLRLQQLLSGLGYLPFTFSRPRNAAAGATATNATATAPIPTTSTPSTSTAIGGSSTTAVGVATTATTVTSATSATGTSGYLTGLEGQPKIANAVSTAPQRGRLSWAYPNIPTSLSALWTEGKSNLVTQGGVMAFEADHGLAVDGVAGPEVWRTLVQAVAARQVDPRPYNYVEVTENSPETLTVWQNGNTDVYSSPANTGASGAATQQGTFPVYLRYTAHAMIGTNPDGTKYNDPDIPWIAYFNGGDAIHGYPRASYGYPQSNGCVELPISNAGQVFNSGEDWYGTLVNVV